MFKVTILLHWLCWNLLRPSGLVSGSEAVCDAASGTCATSNEAAQRPADVASLYGVTQVIEGERSQDTLKRLFEVDKYMREVVRAETRYTAVKDTCRNNDALCTYWASLDPTECDQNPAYMHLNCAPACFTCDKLIFEERCPLNTTGPAAWGPGDLDKFFTRITTDPKYKTTILGQPDMPSNKNTRAMPWIVVLDDFLTEEECIGLVALGTKRGFERSKDVGARKADGTFDSVQSEGRTSLTAWCLEDCFKDPLAQQVIQKLVNLTGIPDDHSEYLQLLQYTEGQRYEMHHDFIPHHVQRNQGPRILTIFLYLNDVEEGGGTHFNDVGVTVMPKQGRALIWPSVKDQNPSQKDERTHHEALAVIKGVKYGANAWVSHIVQTVVCSS